MPEELYEVVALGARYWFLFLMALVVWRSWRWYRRDRREQKKRLRLLPDAGFVGELVVLRGGEELDNGAVLPLPAEGTLGFLRTNDLCLPLAGVEKRHCWLEFDEVRGVRVAPFRGCEAVLDGEDVTDKSEPRYMAHGSRLCVGPVELRLRLFAGYETEAKSRAMPLAEEQEGGVDDAAPAVQPQASMTAAEVYSAALTAAPMDAAMYASLRQEQARYAQQPIPYGSPQYGQQYAQYGQPTSVPPYVSPLSDSSVEVPSVQNGWNSAASPYLSKAGAEFAPPARMSAIERSSILDANLVSDTEAYADDSPPEDQVFYPPEMGDADSEPVFYPPVMDDASEETELPKSAYVGDDEAEKAKRLLWDKYLRR